MAPPSFAPLYPQSLLDRADFVRLTLQTLLDAGFPSAAAALESESGIALESPVVSQFRQAILAGEWDDVHSILVHPDLGLSGRETPAKFLIGQQRFLELLEIGETKKALVILRKELAPLNHDPDRLHLLSSFMMCTSPQELHSRAQWSGVAGNSRQQLLLNIQKFMPPSVVVPHRRIETLIEQARQYQREQCPQHTSNPHGNLFEDHYCDPSYFPSVCSNILSDHKDEVWVVDFSPTGKWLASGSKDKTVIIWRTATFGVYHILSGHEHSVCHLSWSDNETHLLSSAENIIKLWHVESGQCLHTFDKHTYEIGMVAWLDDTRFISVAMDTFLNVFTTSGGCLLSRNMHTDNERTRVPCAALSQDKKTLVCVGVSTDEIDRISASQIAKHAGKRYIVVWDMEEMKVKSFRTISHELTGVSITKDSRYAIINQSSDEINLWDITCSPPQLVATYRGQSQPESVIGNCLGGSYLEPEALIISGSEDSQVYIWNRETGKVIDTLSGHTWGCVSSVAWNPAEKAMLASAGDDGTVRIWEGPKDSNISSSNNISHTINHNSNHSIIRNGVTS